MRRMREAGFTLIEIMIATTILLLLAAMAIPAYYRMIEQVHRVEAKGLLDSLYSSEQAFFAEHNRYGCLNEVGFQIEGSGRFGVWICDSAEGCTGCETPEGCVCPCMAAPDDWVAPSGIARAPMPRMPWGLAAIVPPPGDPWMPGTTDDDDSTGVPYSPGTGPPAHDGFPFPTLPVALPPDCAAVITKPVFEAVSHNWCRRALPEVVDFFWFTTPTGQQYFHLPMQQGPPGDFSNCE